VLTVNNGAVDSGSSQTIYSQTDGVTDNTGRLNITGGSYGCAGIGGTKGTENGTIAIYGGIIALAVVRRRNA